MPSQERTKEHKNLTLRLPDEYHRQLVVQAERTGLTLNAHLVNIVRGHLIDSGYYPDVIKSFSGRLFEISVTEIPRSEHEGSYYCSRFDVTEYHPLYNKRRAHYVFGIATQLAYGSDPYAIVKEVGIGLLNFYNRKALVIDQLAWQQRERDPSSPRLAILDSWRYIGADTARNVAEFLITLGQDRWKDDLLIVTGQSQDIRAGLRTEDDLYSSERPRMLFPQHADFERYASDAVEGWIRSNRREPQLPKEFSDEDYESLPRYVQKQIDHDEYYEIMLRCFKQQKRDKGIQ